MIKTDQKKITIKFLLSLMPLLLYGIYKNGYMVYDRGLIDFYEILDPIYYLVVAIIIYIVFNNKKLKENFFNFELIPYVLISMVVPPSTNFLIYFVVLIISSEIIKSLKKRITINYVCFSYILLSLILLLFNKYTFSNLMELNYSYDLNIFDIVLGRNISGICTSSIVLIFLSFSYLSLSIYYKKDIPLTGLVIYVILSLIYGFISNNFSLLTNSIFYFSIIFVAPMPLSSPYSKRGMIVYGVLVGGLSFILNIFIPKLGSYIAILVGGIFHERCDYLLVKTSNKEEIVESL